MKLTHPYLRLSGVLALGIVIVSYCYFSISNPAYRHFTKAYSELSSLDTPNYLLAALGSFFIPGLLVTLFFIKLHSYIESNNLKKFPFLLLIGSGILTTLGTFPMNYRDFSALTSQLHIIGVMGGGLFFIVGAFTITKQLKKDPKWSSVTKSLLVMLWILIITGFFRESSYPGLAQKIGILAFYSYVAILSWRAHQIYLSKSKFEG